MASSAPCQPAEAMAMASALSTILNRPSSNVEPILSLKKSVIKRKASHIAGNSAADQKYLDGYSSSDEEGTTGGSRASLTARANWKKLREKELLCRRKPDVVTDKPIERAFVRVATRGVVQLFNTVKQHQQTISSTLESAGGLEVKKEKALKSITKGDFLDILKGRKSQESKDKDDADTPSSKKWDALRDDFLAKPKIKDWAKDGVGSDGEEESEED